MSLLAVEGKVHALLLLDIDDIRARNQSVKPLLLEAAVVPDLTLAERIDDSADNRSTTAGRRGSVSYAGFDVDETIGPRREPRRDSIPLRSATEPIGLARPAW